MGVDFEYIALGIPQQNSWVKWKSATLFNWVHAMFNGEKFSSFLKNGLLAKANNTATFLKNNLVTSNRDLSLF